MKTPTHLLVHTCNVQTATESNDDGSVSLSYATASTGVQCRLNPLSADEAIRYGGRRDRKNYVVYFGPGASVPSTSRLTGGSLGSNVLEVIGPARDYDLLGVLQHILAEETE